MKTNLSSGRRLLWRLFYCVVIVLVASALSRAADPQKTRIADVIYRADGSPATGTLVISWPAFTTADHAAVAAGTLDVPIGPGGAVSLELAPNESATPAGTYYKVVLKLDNEASSVEYWSVPKLSPTTIEKIRSTIVPAGVATQTVSRQYVDAAVAGVLHSAGAETVTGEKQFSVSPLVPTPAADLAAANKAYVDSHSGGAHVHSAADVVSGTRVGSRCLHTTSDGSQIAEASADCGAGGSSSDATSIRGKSVDATAPTTGQSLVFNGTSYAPTSDNSVDAIRDCGVKGDGVTDDGPAINACLAAHPGRRILLRATAAACTGGACAFRASYYSSAMLTLSGNGQVLEGVAPALWNAPVGIKFAAGIAGIRIPSDCFGCAVRNLGLYGQSYWNRFDLTTYPAWTPATIVGNGPDGIQALGGYPDIENVDVEGFGRHGIFVDGGGSIQNPSQPDGWKLDNIVVASNRGYGIFVYDGDANTGSARNVNTRWNMLAGIYDRSYYGNVWTMPQSTYDGNIGAAAGSTQAVYSISASGGTCTLTTSAALANGVGTTGTWITIAGTSGGSAFDGAFKVDSVNSGARQLTYACAATSGPASGGTVGTSSGTDIFAALTAQPGSPGIVHGAYVTASGAAVWINPYCESTTASPNFGTGTVIGGNCGSTIVNTNWNYAQYGNDAGQATILSPGLTVTNRQDSANNLTFTSGVNADQWEVTRYVGHTGALQFYEGFIPGPEWVLYDVPNALGVIDYYSQALHLKSAGTNPVIVGYYGGSGGLDIYNGGTTRVAQITGAGQFVSNVATGTPPLSVTSTTKVANLNADLLDGKHDTDFAPAAHIHAAAETVSGTRAGSRCLHTSADGAQIVEASADCGSGGGADPTPALTEDASSVTSTKKLVAPEISTVGAGATVFHVTKGAKPPAEASGLANIYIDSVTSKLTCKDGPGETDCMPSSSVADASSTTKGAIQLAGDLGGTAASPTVPGLASKQDTLAKNVANGYAGLDGSGLLAASQLPKPTASTLGGVYHASDCAAGNHVSGIDTATGQLKCSADSGGATLVTAGGSAGAGPSNQGTATSAARSDHDHRDIKTITWFFPGVPASGVQPMRLTLPDGITNIAILDLRVTVNTPSASATTYNVQRCYNCTASTETSWGDIYSTALTLPANNFSANKASVPDQNVNSLAAGDRFKVNLSGLVGNPADITITMTYKCNTTN